MALTVLAVAAFAAVVSYSHIYDLARLYGQSGTAARLLPLSVDGLILAASLVLLHEAQAGRQAPGLGRLALVLGIGATVAANTVYGLRWGTLGALVSSWPAVALILTAELAFVVIRRVAQAARGQQDRPRTATEPASAAPVATSAIEAVTVAYKASVNVGSPLSARELDRRFGIGRPAAGKVVAAVAAESNGHASPDRLADAIG